jgi:pilus assembly protein CpaE
MKIAILSPSTDNLESIGQLLRGGPHALSLTEGGIARLGAVADKERPDLMIVEGGCRDAGELAPLEYLSQHHPQVMVLMLCSNQSPEFLIHAMRAGVREVLSAPPTQGALLEAVARAEAKLGVVAKRRQPGQILAFIACKGGSGATFLATNLGFQLAAAESKKIIVIDCNLQFGDAVLFAHDRKPITNLADVARGIDRLDASLLASSLVQVTPNFGILAAPEDPGQAMEVKPEHIEAVLNVAASHYDFVIVDVGRILDPVTLRALDKAKLIFPVLQSTLPFIRDANRLLAVFRSLGYPPEKIRLLVNRFEKNGDFTLADIERTLGAHALRTIPNSYAAVAASVNRGTPIAQMARNNPVAKSLAEFADALLPREETGGGWLGRLLKRA